MSLRYLCLAGPTAAGKTAAALGPGARAAAARSSASTRRWSTAAWTSAPPSRRGRARRVPHHLIDILDPRRGLFRGALRAPTRARLIAEIRARGRLPLLVGGTMLYFKALFDGMDAMPAADPALRAAIDAEARERGWPALHAELARVDPATRGAPGAERRAAHPARARSLARHAAGRCRELAARRRRRAAAPAAAADRARAGDRALAARAHRGSASTRCSTAGLVDEVRRAARARRPARRPAVDALRRLPAGLGRRSTAS